MKDQDSHADAKHIRVHLIMHMYPTLVMLVSGIPHTVTLELYEEREKTLILLPNSGQTLTYNFWGDYKIARTLCEDSWSHAHLQDLVPSLMVKGEILWQEQTRMI